MPRRRQDPNPQPALLEVPASQPEPRRRLTEDQVVLQLLYPLVAPLIGFPGWAEDLLPQHKDDITLQRFIHHREIFEREEATDFEAMLYISTATLAAPPSHDWFEIYMWLFSRWKPDVAQEQDLIPSHPDLYPHQQEALTRLKRWLYRQQMEHLKAKLRKEPQAPPKTESRHVGAPETVQGRFF